MRNESVLTYIGGSSIEGSLPLPSEEKYLAVANDIGYGVSNCVLKAVEVFWYGWRRCEGILLVLLLALT